MPRYHVIHQLSGETWQVEAPFADDARRTVGWNVGACQVVLVPEEEWVTFKNGRVAVQVTPPQAGKGIVCSDCNITMAEKSDQEFWWRCPACDLMYYELENRFYREDDLVE